MKKRRVYDLGLNKFLIQKVFRRILYKYKNYNTEVVNQEVLFQLTFLR